MKKTLLLILGVVLICQGAGAQLYYQDSKNPDILRHTACTPVERRNIVIPDVAGYKVFKADLHTHTIYSDGQVLPEIRVREAWANGLDILAITDHYENRKYANDMLAFLKGHVPEGETHPKGVVSDKIDYNISHTSAIGVAEKMGIFLIHGIEISRNPTEYGHFNALFTTDNNTINDKDPEVAIRNARAQGAIIMHNHPGWRRTSLETHAFEDHIYAEGLIDGIEVMNTNDFYPKAIDRAKEYGFFMAGSTDIHHTTAEVYGDQIRNLTMILTNELSEESIREALLDHRTIAYSYGTLAGEEKWLRPLFEACVEVEIVRTNDNGSQLVRLVNNSSLPFVLKTKGRRETILLPSTSQNYTVQPKGLTLSVENAWCGAENNLTITLFPVQK